MPKDHMTDLKADFWKHLKDVRAGMLAPDVPVLADGGDRTIPDRDCTVLDHAGSLPPRVRDRMLAAHDQYVAHRSPFKGRTLARHVSRARPRKQV